jgi:anti-anti-sigma regulatory factor
MTILITRMQQDDTHLLKVDGQLSGDDSALLVDACEAVSGHIVLDLTDLWFADRHGVGTLRELRARGVTLSGLSPYLHLLLAATGLPDCGP